MSSLTDFLLKKNMTKFLSNLPYDFLIKFVWPLKKNRNWLLLLCITFSGMLSHRLHSQMDRKYIWWLLGIILIWVFFKGSTLVRFLLMVGTSLFLALPWFIPNLYINYADFLYRIKSSEWILCFSTARSGSCFFLNELIRINKIRSTTIVWGNFFISK